MHLAQDLVCGLVYRQLGEAVDELVDRRGGDVAEKNRDRGWCRTTSGEITSTWCGGRTGLRTRGVSARMAQAAEVQMELSSSSRKRMASTSSGVTPPTRKSANVEFPLRVRAATISVLAPKTACTLRSATCTWYSTAVNSCHASCSRYWLESRGDGESAAVPEAGCERSDEGVARDTGKPFCRATPAGVAAPPGGVRKNQELDRAPCDLRRQV